MPTLRTAEGQERELRGRFAALFDARPEDLESVFGEFSLKTGIFIDGRLCSLLPFAAEIITVGEQIVAQHFGGRERAGYRDAYDATAQILNQIRGLAGSLEDFKRKTGAEFPQTHGDDLPTRHDRRLHDVWRDFELALQKEFPDCRHLGMSGLLTRLERMQATAEAFLESWGKRYTVPPHRKPKQALNDWIEALANIFVKAGGVIDGRPFKNMVLAIHDRLRLKIAQSDGALDKRVRRFLKGWAPAGKKPISDRRRRIEHDWLTDGDRNWVMAPSPEERRKCTAAIRASGGFAIGTFVISGAQAMEFADYLELEANAGQQLVFPLPGLDKPQKKSGTS